MSSASSAQSLPAAVAAIPVVIADGRETVAGFIGDANPAFVLQFWPVHLSQPRAHIVYLPPFGEEMNRCRASVAEQARQFVRDGFSCTIVDFYGTGESPGDLTDASLTIWQHNIDDVLSQLQQRSACPVYLWGGRLGGLIALHYLSVRPGACSKLLLWQPVNSGGAFVTQMLRQRSAAMMQRGEKAETTAEMKQQLAQGKSIEVGGYQLGGELLNGIDQLEVAAMLKNGGLDNALEIFWLEHIGEDDSELGAKSMRIISELQGHGAQVEVKTFTGDQIWQLNKRSSGADLLAKTRELNL